MHLALVVRQALSSTQTFSVYGSLNEPYETYLVTGLQIGTQGLGVHGSCHIKVHYRMVHRAQVPRTNAETDDKALTGAGKTPIDPPAQVMRPMSIGHTCISCSRRRSSMRLPCARTTAPGKGSEECDVLQHFEEKLVG